MSYIYQVMHLDQTQHNLKYKYGSKFTPTEITYHQTSNNAPAINERNYLNTRTDAVYIGFHLVVDDQVAIECLPLNVQTWHAGDGSSGAGNMKSIGIEMAYSTSSDVSLRNAAIENGAKLIASLMKTYNIPMSKVLPHQARSGKHCPHDILDRYGHEKFRTLIQTEFNKLTSSSSSQTNTSSSSTKLDLQIGNQVKVNSTLSGYQSASSQPASSTLASGKYIVFKVSEGSTHPINISKSAISPGSWVNQSALSLSNSQPFAVGDQVVVSKQLNGYGTSSTTISTTLVSTGTYYVYKYVEGATHAINISKSLGSPGSWVNISDLMLI